MAIGGDPSEIRLLASRARDWEDDLRGVRDRLEGAGDIEWISSAADTYRSRLADRAREAGIAADRVGDLARALDHLATTLESRQDFLAEAFADAKDAWNAAVEAGEDAVEGAWEYAGDMVGFAKDKLGWGR